MAEKTDKKIIQITGDRELMQQYAATRGLILNTTLMIKLIKRVRVYTKY